MYLDDVIDLDSRFLTWEAGRRNENTKNNEHQVTAMYAGGSCKDSKV
ncbi:hypothetical protein MGYG_06090 [Nannizzia gypsea CBS 118893]|uniref:Uncharacterized protein n=1 Tax=Arthroderma gypseum (strain ATCC MYA-4604 / CBS 118893) TaxID=535722 RepID=E4V0F8_ARTGP|nr:hypothetical protein MGYG_06090 [Nannizzia gypsea CBS 118893]EFR03095.1 hypothetical protein MGYG_06090 [Nannizzia gypsea CBS 118893]